MTSPFAASPTARRFLVASLTCGLLLTVSPIAADAAKRPSGAMKLKASQMKTVGTVKCGKVKGSWLPGTKLSGGYFITHAQQAKNYKALAKKTKGSAKKKAGKQASSYAAKAKSQLGSCRGNSPRSTAVRFDFSKAKALVLGSSSSVASRSTARASSGNSNLSVLLASGQLRDAVIQGSVKVGLVVAGPARKIYVVFPEGVNLDDSAQSGSCRFAQVDQDTGIPICIDSSLSGIGELGREDLHLGDPPGGWVQFDAAGNVYYWGYGTPPVGSGFPPKVLRRWSNGTVTDLVNTTDVTADDFQTLPDGSVLVAGESSLDGAWLRRINASGSVQTLKHMSGHNFGIFPDGNVYWGLYGLGGGGVHRYLTSSGQFEEKRWLGNSEPPDVYFSVDAVCPYSNPLCSSFAGFFGTLAQTFFPGDGTVFAVSGTRFYPGPLFKYYPTVELVDTSVSQIMVAEAAGNNLILAGLDGQGRHVLVLHSTSNGVETELLSPGEVEIYHLSYSPASGKVIYDGLRLSDNKPVMGEVDLASRTANISTTLSAKPSSVEGL